MVSGPRPAIWVSVFTYARGTLHAIGNPVAALPPKSWSMVAWASVAVFLVALTYLLTFVLGLICFLFGLLTLLAMLKALSPLGVLLGLFTFILGATVLWSLLPRRIPFQTNGVPVDLSHEPRLSAEIAALANALNEKMPDEVYLVPVANAAVLEHGKRRIMLLGLPLLQLLTVSQFRAILAHEFGHYYSGDTRMGPWIFRARMNMAQVINRLGGDSAVLSFLSHWAVVAILRLIVLGGLSLWWKLFNRLAQHVSRKQEYRCDELACHIAGSESLEQGLRSVILAGAAFAAYVNHVVIPVAVGGFRPQLGDGFGRFLRAPEIAHAASAVLDKQLASHTSDPMDSHPPLSARIGKARALSIAVVNSDGRPAVSLFEDLPRLEVQLLARLLPALNPGALKPMEWDTAGSVVYIPLWRSEVAKVAPALNAVTIHTLPAILTNLAPIAGRIPDPPGTLLTREQRAGRAADGIAHALTLALLDHGWKLRMQPGEFYVENETGARLNPRTVIEELRKGKRTADTWPHFCDANAIGDWPLAPQATETASQSV